MAIEPVRRARLFLHRRPSRDDAQIAIDLHGIGVDDDAAALLPQFSEFACMSLVATLICNPANPALDATIVDGALAVLPSPGQARWLFDEVAVDIPFDTQVKSPDDIKAIAT